MVWFWVILLAVAVAVAVAVLVVRRRPTTRTTTAPPHAAEAGEVPLRYRPAIDGPWLGPTATVRLDIQATDPGAASVQRLVGAATSRVFRTSPDVEEVIVEDRAGTELARIPRQVPSPGPPPTRPERAQPHARPRGTWKEPDTVPSWDEPTVGRRPLADRLDLPPEVRERVRHDDDAIDVVRAILDAAGQPVEVTGSLVRSGDDVVIVVQDTGSAGGAALSQAFLRFRDSGARRGVVVHLGYVDPREVRRRRALVPQLHHAGPEVLQQMADAVALGGDPVQFALADAAS